MKIFKNTLIISSYVLLAALLFSGAYVVGKTLMDETNEDYAEPVYNDSAEPFSKELIKAPIYEVTAEDGKIIIYKCIGDTKTVITSEEISESVFPKEDIEELRGGVVFERLESAQQMFENFVS